MKKTLALTIVTLLLGSMLASCTIAGHLRRSGATAAAGYVPRNIRKEVTGADTTRYITYVRPDKTTAYMVPAERDEHGEMVMTLRVPEVVVTAPSRMVAERRGQVDIDFLVTLPQQLQGAYRALTVTPVVHTSSSALRLEPLSLRGRIFDRVQHRDYWLAGRVARRSKDGAASARLIRNPYPMGIRMDTVPDKPVTITYRYEQKVPSAGVGRRLEVTLEGTVAGLDGTTYRLPPGDTLRFSISSMLTFADTTAIPDDKGYAGAIGRMKAKDYAGALQILSGYRDRNTAVCLLSLGYDTTAYKVLSALPSDASVEYLKALACVRLGLTDEAQACYRRACELDERMKYRGRRDPEINSLKPKDDEEEN